VSVLENLLRVIAANFKGWEIFLSNQGISLKETLKIPWWEAAFGTALIGFVGMSRRKKVV
jgi:hypothetical protein